MGDRWQGQFPIATGMEAPEYPRTMSENSFRKAQETRFKNLTAKKAARGILEENEEKELVKLAGLITPRTSSNGSKQL